MNTNQVEITRIIVKQVDKGLLCRPQNLKPFHVGNSVVFSIRHYVLCHRRIVFYALKTRGKLIKQFLEWRNTRFVAFVSYLVHTQNRCSRKSYEL